MGTYRRFLASLLFVAATHGMAADCPASSEKKASVEAFFSPWDDALGEILASLDAACEQVLVQAFVLSHRDVAERLIAAHRRGVDVRVLADARQHADTPGSLLPRLARAGIPVSLENRYRHAHNKVMVIDADSPQPVVITGSYNFTWSAQHTTAENLLILRGHPVLARRYAANWARHHADANPLLALQ